MKTRPRFALFLLLFSTGAATAATVLSGAMIVACRIDSAELDGPWKIPSENYRAKGMVLLQDESSFQVKRERLFVSDHWVVPTRFRGDARYPGRICLSPEDAIGILIAATPDS